MEIPDHQTIMPATRLMTIFLTSGKRYPCQEGAVNIGLSIGCNYNMNSIAPEKT
jgi:hypothetical protein